MVVAIKNFLGKYKYDKNNHIIYWNKLRLVLDDFINFKKVLKLEKNKSILVKYMGKNYKYLFDFAYYFPYVYKYYKKSRYILKLNENSYR